MKIISVKDCPRCDLFKKRNKNISYIELPNCDFGLGDTIYRILKFLRFSSCSNCKIRQSYLNKWFPYKWNKKITENHRIIKNKLLKLNAGKYPVLVDDDLTKTYSLYTVDKFFEYKL
jgi:hypothetical protein